MSEYISMWKNCFNSSGRSTRKEYWMAYLVNIIVIFVISFIFRNDSDLLGLYLLVTSLPMLTLFIRRLHDINRSGLWFFIIFIPFAGFIIILFFLCTKSVDENNNYPY